VGGLGLRFALLLVQRVVGAFELFLRVEQFGLEVEHALEQLLMRHGTGRLLQLLQPQVQKLGLPPLRVRHFRPVFRLFFVRMELHQLLIVQSRRFANRSRAKKAAIELVAAHAISASVSLSATVFIRIRSICLL
jgi:hypothetical protein